MVWICVFLMHSLGHKLFYHCFNIQCISYVSRGRPSSWLLCVCFVCLFVSFWCSHRSLSVSLLSGIIAYSRFILYFPFATLVHFHISIISIDYYHFRVLSVDRSRKYMYVCHGFLSCMGLCMPTKPTLLHNWVTICSFRAFTSAISHLLFQ